MFGFFGVFLLLFLFFFLEENILTKTPINLNIIHSALVERVNGIFGEQKIFEKIAVNFSHIISQVYI